MRIPYICLALCLAGSALAQDTARARTLYKGARAALSAGKTDDAIKLLQRATELDPQNWEYHMWLGHGYTRQIATVNFMRKATIGRRIGAEYDKAVELAPQSVEAAEARMDFFLEAPGIVGGGEDKARAEAARIATLSKYRGRFAAARIAERTKNPAGAETEYRALTAEYPDSSLPVVTLATFYQTHARYDEAFAVVDRRLTRFPDDTSTVYQLGRIAAISGKQLSRGEAALRKFLAMLGASDTLSQSHGHYRLGMIKEKLGDSTSARAEYARAVELNPRHEPAASALKKLR